MVYYTYDEMDYIRNLCLVRLFFLHNCRLDILMLVNIKGSTKTTRKLVESAVWDYAERMMSTRLVKTLVLTLILFAITTKRKVVKVLAYGIIGMI